VDRAAAEEWIRSHVEPTGEIELEHERPWSTVLRVPVDDTAVWFKACNRVQAFEPRLTAGLYARWPDRIADVLACDEERAWLLLADGGMPVGAFGNSPEAWNAALPLYAELQRGETAHAADHLAHGVPDLRVEMLPAHYEAMLSRDIPVEPHEVERLRGFAPRFAELCAELIARGIPDTIQHDDLHIANVYERNGRMLILDWGDASISHPFASLVVTFQFLDHVNHLPPGDPWYARLRDAYLEPWGDDLVDTFDLAFRVGTIAHVFAWFRQFDHLPDDDARAEFMQWFPANIRRAVAQTGDRYA
jgi:hypothetical protein